MSNNIIVCYQQLSCCEFDMEIIEIIVNILTMFDRQTFKLFWVIL